MKIRSIFYKLIIFSLILFVFTSCKTDEKESEPCEYSLIESEGYDFNPTTGKVKFGYYKYSYSFISVHNENDFELVITKNVNDITSSKNFEITFENRGKNISPCDNYFDRAYFVNSDYDQGISGSLVCNKCETSTIPDLVIMKLPENPKVTALYPIQGEQNVCLGGIFPYNAKLNEDEEWVMKFVSDSHPERNVEHTIPVKYTKEIKAWLAKVENAGTEGLQPKQ